MAEDRIPLCLNATLVSKFPLIDSLLALGKCNNREDYGHYQSEGHGARDDALSPGSSFATRDDVFSLERCRLAFFVGGGLREPLLGLLQIVSAQDEAVVLTLCFPIQAHV